MCKWAVACNVFEFEDRDILASETCHNYRCVFALVLEHLNVHCGAQNAHLVYCSGTFVTVLLAGEQNEWLFVLD